jgi:hypothetical protein
MVMVFLFHCARFFNYEDWHVKNTRLDFGMSVFVEVLSHWIMPLFFVLSAFSAYYALGRLTAGQYAWERLRRLLIPLIVGTLILIPPQVYIERVSHFQFSGSFIQFLPHYFDGFYGFGGNFAWMGLHLWYLEVLLIFSLLTLPLFSYLRGETARRFIAKAAGWVKAPGAIFLLAIPLAIMELIVSLQPEGIGRRDFGGWSLLTYLVFFVLGYLIASADLFQRSIERHRVAALIAGVMTISAGLYLLRSGYASPVLFATLRAFNSWFWLVAALGFGTRYLRFNNAFLKYANAAVLPFYILHQTVIVIMGFWIASWDADVMLKYLIISTLSFIAIAVLYELVVKRFPLLRFLFGMKQQQVKPVNTLYLAD